MKQITKVEEVYRTQKNWQGIKDFMFSTDCPICSESQTLAEGEVILEHGATVYHCKYGCGPKLVVVDPTSTKYNKGTPLGTLLGQFIIRNPSNLILSIPGAIPMKFEAIKRKLE
jgi:hypothetical protein